MDEFLNAVRGVFSGQAFGWNNVLDIAIVFVFVYYLLRLIRGTRAVQLLLGVLVLVLRQYRRAWPLAVVAGMGFGGTALAVRAAHIEIGEGFSFVALLAQPSIYLITGYWVVGIIAYSAALSRGEVGIVTAVFIVTEVVMPGLTGILLLGDPVREGWGWIFVVGLIVSMVGVVALARRPPPRRRRVR